MRQQNGSGVTLARVLTNYQPWADLDDELLVVAEELRVGPVEDVHHLARQLEGRALEGELASWADAQHKAEVDVDHVTLLVFYWDGWVVGGPLDELIDVATCVCVSTCH